MRILAPKLSIFAAALLLTAGTALAQVGALKGKVTDENGGPVVGALIKIERNDVKGSYQVKTKKKGTYFHAGLPLGRYTVALWIDGKQVDSIGGVRVGSGSEDVNFDLSELKARQAQAQAAADANDGVATKEQLSQMSASQRKEYEAQLKARQQQLSKNKELNDAFNSGMEAMRLKDYATAETQLAKAGELDPAQHTVWANLANAQSSLAKGKTGADKEAYYAKTMASWDKALAIQPENAAYHNNYGLALIEAGKLDEGKVQLAKAAELDPVNGGRYWFNLGAVMINSNNTEGAIDAFQKAVEVQPDYANAHYQLGVAMVGAAEYKEDGTVVPRPGTVEAFENYIKLEPNGAQAQQAQMMIQTLTGTVATGFKDPDAGKKKRKK